MQTVPHAPRTMQFAFQEVIIASSGITNAERSRSDGADCRRTNQDGSFFLSFHNPLARIALGDPLRNGCDDTETKVYSFIHHCTCAAQRRKIYQGIGLCVGCVRICK